MRIPVQSQVDLKAQSRARCTKTLLILTAALMVAAADVASAQNATADVEAQARAQAQQNAITDRYLTAVSAELTSNVDTKNATVGQEVSAKTLAEARLADGTSLPKGTRLVGHVTQVKAGGPEQGSAILTLMFDHAEVKPGQSVPVRSVIRTVTSSARAEAARRDIMAEPSTSMSVPNPTVNTTGRGSGGGIGGTSGPTIGNGGGGTGSTTPGMPGSTGSTVPGMPGSTGSTGGMPGGPSIGNSGPIIRGSTGGLGSMGEPASAPSNRKVQQEGETLSGAPHATGLPGVLLWATPVASGTLTAMGHNISLDTGVQMTLGVISR